MKAKELRPQPLLTPPTVGWQEGRELTPEDMLLVERRESGLISSLADPYSKAALAHIYARLAELGVMRRVKPAVAAAISKAPDQFAEAERGIYFVPNIAGAHRDLRVLGLRDDLPESHRRLIEASLSSSHRMGGLDLTVLMSGGVLGLTTALLPTEESDVRGALSEARIARDGVRVSNARLTLQAFGKSAGGDDEDARLLAESAERFRGEGDVHRLLTVLAAAKKTLPQPVGSRAHQPMPPLKRFRG